jgi:hypothetical protein
MVHPATFIENIAKDENDFWVEYCESRLEGTMHLKIDGIPEFI